MTTEQLANAVTFLAHYVASKVSATGLTVTVDVYEITKAGATTEIVTAGSAVEVGDGIYLYVLASGSVDVEGEYVGVFKTSDSSVDQQHIPAVWSIQRAGVEQLDAAISSRGTSTLTQQQANTAALAALTTYDPSTNAEMLAAFAALNNLDAAAVLAQAGAALTAYDPPTDAEMLAAFAALNDLSAAQVNAEVDTALADYDPPTNAEMLAAIASLASNGGVTVVSAVSGSAIAMYQYDTWLFTVTDASLALTDYDNLLFVVKRSEGLTDAESILFVDITIGLLYIGEAAASAASAGSLTPNSATSFTVQIAMSEVAGKVNSAHEGTHTWYLKGIDTDDNPDQGFVLATGSFVVKESGARAIL